MTYSNGFVLCILVNGRVQKEHRNGTVDLPFGTEYTIRLRNKNDRRAVATILVDEENVSGNGYIVEARSFIDIKRHNDRDRAFKFVDLDSEEAVDAGKNGDNFDKSKGTVEARFYFEKKRPQVSIPRPIRRRRDPWYPWINPSPYKWESGTGDLQYRATKGGPSGQSTGDKTVHLQSMGFCGQELYASNSVSAPDIQRSVSDLDLEDGCTVEGNATGQSFGSEYIDIESNFTTCRLFLQGYRTEEPVFQHSHVETEYCESCGTKRTKKSANFCYKCGHKL